MNVLLSLNGVHVPVEREVFVALFKNSVVADRASISRAIDGKPLAFNEFLGLTRQAEIPYPLFFAPLNLVMSQIELKTKKLMVGFTRDSFSMHSRHRVELSDVELIVKDLLRKQELLRKNDSSLTLNKVVGLLKNSNNTVANDASLLMSALGLCRADIRSARTKAKALEVVISRLEANQIFVSRSAQHFMPQSIPAHVKFSGMTIKDKKVPFIFLATGDEGEHLEADGRKLFTLTLLTVLIAMGTFATVSYDGHTKEASSPREYELTAEILLPAAELLAVSFSGLQAVKDTADQYMVTPSAVAMRAYRLGRIGKGTFEIYMDALKGEYTAREKKPMRSALPINALKKYNGVECSRRMLTMLDAGLINRSEFRRVMFANKLPVTHIEQFRAAVR